MKFNKIKGLILLLTAVPFVLATAVSAAEAPGNCVSEEEARLLDAVNAYRIDNGLSAVPWSKSLITVAQWHAWDAGANTPFDQACNLHSWSAARPAPARRQSSTAWTAPSWSPRTARETANAGVATAAAN